MAPRGVKGGDTRLPAVTRRSLLRRALALTAATGGLAALAGCGLVDPARLGAPPDLVLLDPGRAPGAAAPDLGDVARAFGTAYNRAVGATARVVVRRPPGSAATYSGAAYMRALLADAPPLAADLLLTTPAVRNLLDAPGLMVDLGPALARTGLAAGLYPELLRYCAPGGRQRMIPVFRDPLVLYYNVDAFSRAGVDPPVGTWSVDRLLWLCQKLQTRQAGRVTPLANAVGAFDLELLAAFVRGYGGEMLSPLGGSGSGGSGPASGYAPAFAAPAALLGIDALLQLHPYEPARPTAPPRTLFARGDAAMYFGHHRDVFALRTQIAGLFAWNVAALPRFPQRAAQPVFAEGLAAIARNPAHRIPATAAALYAASPAGQAAMAATGYGVPALRALAGSPTWRQAAPHLHNEVFVADTAADFVVAPALHYIGPQLRAALVAARDGAPVATIFEQASTAVEFTLQTWPNV